MNLVPSALGIFLSMTLLATPTRSRAVEVPEVAPASAEMASAQTASAAGTVEAGAPAATPASKAPPEARPPTAEAPASPLSLQPADAPGVVRLAVVLTLAALLPAIAICMTPFLRIVVVLSMIRHAFGMPETPPTQVLVSLALFLTLFVMGPTLATVNTEALHPFVNGKLSVEQALDKAAAPTRAFMLRQVHDEDIKAIYDISKKPLPSKATGVGLMELTSAFMFNELRVSFKMGFVVLLPFLLIDLVVSSILLSLGMLMVPPSTLSLPIKVLMFVLIDGWSLVLQGVVGSFR